MNDDLKMEAETSRALAARNGIAKGAYVLANGFPGIVRDGYAKRPIRTIEVWGIVHEMGSVYRSDIMEITKEQFERLKAGQPCGQEAPYRLR